MDQQGLTADSASSPSRTPEPFLIGEIMSEAWALTGGSKALFFLGFFLIILVSVVVTVGLHWAGGVPFDPAQSTDFSVNTLSGTHLSFASEDGLASNLISQINNLIVGPLLAGLILYAVKRGRHDVGAGRNDIFAPYSRIFALYGLQILQVILIIIGFILLIIPGIYLAVAYAMTIPLLVDKELGIWASLETSRKTISKVWFRYLGLLFATGLVFILGSLFTLGIGLIWILPWVFLVQGVAYRRLFGSGALPSEVTDQSPV